MYGARFGGGGASGGWRGYGRSQGTRTRSRGGRWGGGTRRRSFGVRGGNVSFFSSLSITEGTTESSAILAFVPFIHSGYWLDEQQRWTGESHTTQWEGSLEAVRVVHGQWRIQLWPTNYDAGPLVQRLIPYHVGLAIVPAYDTAGVGDPNDFAPTALPNYFVRDWGHIALGQASSPDTSTYPGPAATSLRTLYRDAGIVDCSSVDLDRAPPTGYVHRCITKPFTLRRHDMFGFVLNAINTTAGDDMILGFRVTGHFGYRRYRRAE